MQRALRQFFCLLMLSILAGLLTWAFHPNAPEWDPRRQAEGAVAADFARAHAGEILWIDARPEEDYREQHIPGAVLLNEDDWEGGLMRLFDVWEPGQTLVVYCGAEACRTSQTVMWRLRKELQDDAVYYLEGGWDAWAEGGGLEP